MVVLQGAEFLAIALIIVYAGAVLVTYVFVIMLAQQASLSVCDIRAREPFAGVLVGFVAMAAVAGRIADPSAVGAGPQPPQQALSGVGAQNETTSAESAAAADNAAQAGNQLDEGNTVGIGRALFGHYVVAIQLAGLLLLVGMIGALALVRKKVPRDVPAEPPIQLGRAGREVKPF
jgi:NADH-quinone oxidoreductase subunit J